MRMQKYCLLIFCLFFVSSCTTDLDVIEQRLDDLEKKDSLEIKDPSVFDVSFLASDNPLQLISDIKGKIECDSLIECWANHIMESKLLVPHINWKGRSLTLNGKDYIEKQTYDFSAPVELIVTDGEKEKKYYIRFHSYTGIPVVYIKTDGNVPIDSKENYVHASFVIKEDIITRSSGVVFADSVYVKGRGNYTWNHPKKPYRLKFDKKVSLLGEPKDKSWVLLANYTDRTFLRNYIAFF